MHKIKKNFTFYQLCLVLVDNEKKIMFFWALQVNFKNDFKSLQFQLIKKSEKFFQFGRGHA